MTTAGRHQRQRERRCRDRVRAARPHGRCTLLPAGAPTAAVPAAVWSRPDSRPFDLLDVALVAQMLVVAGRAPLTVTAGGEDVATLAADAEQVAALRSVVWDTTPERMEAWMHALAPRLVHDVVALTGSEWAAEAEVSVELALALRADDVEDLAEQLEAGTVRVDASRSAAQVVAADVPDPALVHFV
ncbi:hypothetical protein [Thalassiella azotivora]